MFKSGGKTDKTGLHFEMGGNATFIGVGAVFKGNLSCHSLRVDGAIEGDIHSDGDIEISATGRVAGQKITARNIIVHGQVVSNIHAEGFLRIHKKANVQGNVHAQALDIESGAQFVGYSHTGSDLAQAEQPKLNDAAKTVIDVQ